MDPNATFQLWQQALRQHDLEQAVETATNLVTWLSRGGFEPNLQEREKAFFNEWCDEFGI